MSHMGVGKVIDKLLTDENLRTRFALDRIETVAELCLRGAELTRDEIDLLCQTDARSVVPGGELEGGRRHCTPFPLQRQPFENARTVRHRTSRPTHDRRLMRRNRGGITFAIG